MSDQAKKLTASSIFRRCDQGPRMCMTLLFCPSKTNTEIKNEGTKKRVTPDLDPYLSFYSPRNTSDKISEVPWACNMITPPPTLPPLTPTMPSSKCSSPESQSVTVLRFGPKGKPKNDELEVQRKRLECAFVCVFNKSEFTTTELN